MELTGSPASYTLGMAESKAVSAKSMYFTFVVMCTDKNGVYCLNQRVDLYSIAAKIVLATDIPIFSAYAAGYRRFQYIR
jgi:hypothetical protein